MSDLSRMIPMATLYQGFGNKVKTLRKEAGLSQEQLAELIKTDVRTVVAIEGGNRNPTMKTINKISKAFKVSLSDLLHF